MDRSTLIVGAIFELIALVVIMRLWVRRPLRVVSSSLWSMVLLLPFFGLFIYFFMREKPEANGEYVSDPSGRSTGVG